MEWTLSDTVFCLVMIGFLLWPVVIHVLLNLVDW